MKRYAWPAAILLILCITCPGVRAERPVITIMTHDSFAVSEALIARFQETHGVELKLLKSGDAGAALNQAILSRNNPMADLFFGVDNTLMSRALKADIFEPYASPLLARIPDRFRLDPEHRLLPVDYGDVCLNYDKAWFAEHQLAPPSDLPDLVKPAYKGLTVVQNPATSSPGLAFLLTTVGRFGTDGYIDYWRQLRENGVYVANGWSDAYYGQFTRAKTGTRPIVVSYAGSPAAEVFYSEQKPEAAPTGAVLAPQTAFRQIEFVGILKGTPHRELAARVVDFMLSPAFQADIPLNMWVFPVRPDAPLPDLFQRHARQAENPVMLTPEAIAQGHRRWLESWTETVLH